MKAHPGQIIRVDQGGLMFYGGLILALVVFYVVRGSIRSPRPRFSPLAPAVPVPPAEPPAGR